MKKLNSVDQKHLEALLNSAINFTEFQYEDILELQKFIELHDLEHELRKALKIKINAAIRELHQNHPAYHLKTK